MGRLINADALMRAMYERAFETDGDTMWQSGCWVRYRAIEEVVKEQPTIEPQRWIPCSERLPEESGKYLISVLDGVGRRTTVAPYQPRYKTWTMTGRMAYWKVVAWMPLQEPYKEDET